MASLAALPLRPFVLARLSPPVGSPVITFSLRLMTCFASIRAHIERRVRRLPQRTQILLLVAGSSANLKSDAGEEKHAEPSEERKWAYTKWRHLNSVSKAFRTVAQSRQANTNTRVSLARKNSSVCDADHH